MTLQRHRAGALGVLSFLFLAPGCGERASVLAPSPDPATIELGARLVPQAEPDAATYRISWQPASGQARTVLYALAPAGAAIPDLAWKATTEPTFLIDVPLAGPERESGDPPPPTVLRVRAADFRGRPSPITSLGFFGDNVAPQVQIVLPRPSALTRAVLPPSFEVRWEGVDPDGNGQQRPRLYKWKLLDGSSEVTYATALANPDSVRRYYEPLGYPTWDSLAGARHGETAIRLSGLVPGNNYLFVVVARDAEGAWSPVFSLNTNMLNFRCVSPGSAGPLLTLYNESFYYRYPVPSYSADPRYEIPITVASGVRVPIRWFGLPPAGTEIEGYRWALDLADPVAPSEPAGLRGLREDPGAPAAGPERGRWSRLSPQLTSAELGPFGPGETHRLYVEARDRFGFKSLGIVRLSTLVPEERRPLLIVDDTRFPVDQRSPANTCMNPPIGRWPTAAELDTFLFARGGVPWRCYPAGTRSTPGLFAGYDFDTLDTRGLPGGVVPLATLARYERVLWLTDLTGATFSGPPDPRTTSSTALRLMTAPGSQNPLAEFARGGGRLWVAGSGATFASMIHFDRRDNNTTPPAPGTTYSFDRGELAPGRFPYDVFGWRSEIKVTQSTIQLSRFLGRFEGGASPYSGLPVAMRTRVASSDPYPPGRSFVSGNFYYTNYGLEYLSRPNRIPNNDPDSRPGPDGSALDTLFRAVGSSLMPPQDNPHNVAMTRYHGAFKHNPVLFTGFDLWSFRREDCKALVDFVLQQLWGLHPAPAAVARREPAVPDPGRSRPGP